MLAFRLTRHLRWHRWMNTLPRHSNTWYRSVICIIITLAYTLYSFWLLMKTLFQYFPKCYLLVFLVDKEVSNWMYLYIVDIRGSFQKFCTLYVFFLKINLFYKIHLQAFNLISIVLYHSGPMFGQVLYSCLDAFVVDASDYSGHLIRHLLNASEAFPTERFLQFWEQVKVFWAERVWCVRVHACVHVRARVCVHVCAHCVWARATSSPRQILP
jgi:hypothetical protein